MDIVKEVYVFSQDPEKALKLQKATAKQRAVCRLLMNPFLKEAVVLSKKKMDIKDDDEEWKKMLFEMGKNKKKKLNKIMYEAKSTPTPVSDAATPSLEKKIAGRIAKNKEKKAAKKELKLADTSKTIDAKQRKEKLEQKKTQIAKPSVSSTSKMDREPRKVNLFPMESSAHKEKPNDSGKVKWSKEIAPRNNSFAPKPSSGFAKKPQPIEKPKETLHPSWEAKKQKKPAISEFKGKKITFDD